MELKFLNLEDKDQGVVQLTLSSPKTRNSMHQDMVKDLNKAMEYINRREDVGAMVVTGEGKAFSSGGDLREMFEREMKMDEAYEMVKSYYPFIETLTNMPFPVIAAVNGAAIGAGFNLALACDIIYASTEAIFSQAFVLVGLTPDMGGTYYLPRIVGLHRAKELIYSGRQLSAQEALEMGIVSKVLEPEKLLPETLATAARLAVGPKIALKLAKNMLNQSYKRDLQETLEVEALCQATCFQTEDQKEGAAAFLEKRNPVFKGR